jgi:regulator of CtrA degradation
MGVRHGRFKKVLQSGKPVRALPQFVAAPSSFGHDRPMNQDIEGQEGQTPVFAAPLYFSRTYDETMSLLHEARNCIIRFGDEPSMTTAGRLSYARETMRLTTRLTSVMAWLLAQRAVHAGEMTPQHAASAAHELTARELCLTTADADDTALLPAELQLLMEKSRALYARVARLETQVKATA